MLTGDDIVAWPGHIERGATDPNYDWVAGFEEQSGCQVRVKTANTSDEMATLHPVRLGR